MVNLMQSRPNNTQDCLIDADTHLKQLAPACFPRPCTLGAEFEPGLKQPSDAKGTPEVHGRGPDGKLMTIR